MNETLLTLLKERFDNLKTVDNIELRKQAEQLIEATLKIEQQPDYVISDTMEHIITSYSYKEIMQLSRKWNMVIRGRKIDLINQMVDDMIYRIKKEKPTDTKATEEKPEDIKPELEKWTERDIKQISEKVYKRIKEKIAEKEKKSTVFTSKAKPKNAVVKEKTYGILITKPDVLKVKQAIEKVETGYTPTTLNIQRVTGFSLNKTRGLLSNMRKTKQITSDRAGKGQPIHRTTHITEIMT